MQIETRLAHRSNYGGKRTGKVEYLVIHYTGNDGDSAYSNARYFEQALTPPVSAHYFVDDQRIVRTVPEDHIAYHCGASTYRHPRCRNGNSIGIELCDSCRDGAVMVTDKTLRRAAELVGQLMKVYNIPADRVLRHYDVTGKNCPAYWVEDPAGFEAFKVLAASGGLVERSQVILDGEPVPVERILWQGTNYIKLRDLAAALDLEVGHVGSIAVLNRRKT